MELERLAPPQLDALREVANIGAGHAATALSQMTGVRIGVEVPKLQIVPLEETAEMVAGPDEVVAAVLMHMVGDLSGRTLLVFPEDSARRIAEILLKRPVGDVRNFGELERSALREVGNILAAAYMNALSDFLGLMLLPSIPSLAVDLCAAIVTTAYANFGHDRDRAMSIRTSFSMDSESVLAYFILLPDSESLDVILRAVRLE
ncbi:chemotaxis protein CheC [soil metagenome]|jgi:chemotaxis protein CheC